MKDATPFPAINTMLTEWVEGLQRSLGKNNIVGPYLSGSLACGDFVPERSDIDLQAVVRNRLTQDELRAVPDGQIGLSAPTFLSNSCAN